MKRLGQFPPTLHVKKALNVVSLYQIKSSLFRHRISLKIESGVFTINKINKINKINIYIYIYIHYISIYR